MQQYGLDLRHLFCYHLRRDRLRRDALPPGDSLLFVAGALAAIGEGGMDIFVLMASAGAINRRQHGQLSDRPLPRPQRFPLGKLAFLQQERPRPRPMPSTKPGGKTLIVSRFLPLFRTFARSSSPASAPTYAPLFTVFSLIGAVGRGFPLCLGRLLVRQRAWVTQNLSAVIVGIIVVSCPGGYRLPEEHARA